MLIVEPWIKLELQKGHISLPISNAEPSTAVVKIERQNLKLKYADSIPMLWPAKRMKHVTLTAKNGQDVKVKLIGNIKSPTDFCVHRCDDFPRIEEMDRIIDKEVPTLSIRSKKRFSFDSTYPM